MAASRSRCAGWGSAARAGAAAELTWLVFTPVLGDGMTVGTRVDVGDVAAVGVAVGDVVKDGDGPGVGGALVGLAAGDEVMVGAGEEVGVAVAVGLTVGVVVAVGV